VLSLVVFDVDGTLVDSQAHIWAAMVAAHEGCDLPLPARAAVLSIVGLSLPVAMARLHPHGTAAQLDALVTAYKGAFGALRADMLSPLYPGMREVVMDLAAREGVVLGVATGKSRRGLDHILQAHGLAELFVTTQVADDHPSKPDPSMIRAALAETGAGRAVMIGDTTFDMEMGRAAGVGCLGVSWGYHRAEALVQAGAQGVVDHSHALPAAIEQIWRAQ
jgi:phosphoglycolate phosphatase